MGYGSFSTIPTQGLIFVILSMLQARMPHDAWLERRLPLNLFVVRYWSFITFTFSYLNPQKAVLIDGRGRQDQLSCFSHTSNTQVYGSCSLTWHNGFYVFGGRDNRRQISQVIGTRLTQIGKLSFDHCAGSCDVMGGDKIYLCFNYYASTYDYNRCRLALSPLGKFSQIQPSKYAHTLVDIAASDCKCQQHFNTFFIPKLALNQP